MGIGTRVKYSEKFLRSLTDNPIHLSSMLTEERRGEVVGLDLSPLPCHYYVKWDDEKSRDLSRTVSYPRNALDNID